MMQDIHPVLHAFNTTRSILARYLPAERLEALAAHIEARASAATPVILVYGVYNAGKSTLINALLGRAEAPMGCVPTTAQTHPYQWRGYTVLDSPGIDALSEHERVAQAQCERSDVVIFVINSSPAADELRTYTCMLEFVARKQRVMLVINNTSGIRWGSAEQFAVVDEVRANVQKQASIHSQEIQKAVAQIPIHWLDAKLALEGRLTQQPAFVHHSGIIPFEQSLHSFIAATDKSALTKSLASQLHSVFEEVLAEIESRQTNEHDAQLSRIQTRLMNEDARLRNVFAEFIRHQQQHLKSHIKALLNHPMQDQMQVEQAMQALSETLGNALQQRLEQELEHTARLTTTLNQTLGQIPPPAIALHPEAVLPVSPETSAPNAVELDQLLQTHQDKVALLLKSIKEEHIITVLTTVKAYFPSLLKGIGPKTMEKIAGKWVGILTKGVPVVSIGLQAILGAVDYYRAQQAQEEEINAKQRYFQQVNDLAEQLSQQYQYAANTVIEQCIVQVLQPALETLQAMQTTLQTQSTQQAQDQQSLQSAANQLKRL
ncbi:GTPase [Thiorhodospira sibirica]|uniref:GTPase n=1 Tax=Thiorhodospira sibirica TaxID=154347 RepID=UPI00022C5E1A|nr:GTPase [Thiorhodospira sibirica]